jgi:hypothetical protein
VRLESVEGEFLLVDEFSQLRDEVGGEGVEVGELVLDASQVGVDFGCDALLDVVAQLDETQESQVLS